MILLKLEQVSYCHNIFRKSGEFSDKAVFD